MDYTERIVPVPVPVPVSGSFRSALKIVRTKNLQGSLSQRSIQRRT